MPLTAYTSTQVRREVLCIVFILKRSWWMDFYQNLRVNLFCWTFHDSFTFFSRNFLLCKAIFISSIKVIFACLLFILLFIFAYYSFKRYRNWNCLHYFYEALIMLSLFFSFVEKVTKNLNWFTWCVVMVDDLYVLWSIFTIDNDEIGLPSDRMHFINGPLCLSVYFLTRGFTFPSDEFVSIGFSFYKDEFVFGFSHHERPSFLVILFLLKLFNSFPQTSSLHDTVKYYFDFCFFLPK